MILSGSFCPRVSPHFMVAEATSSFGPAKAAELVSNRLLSKNTTTVDLRNRIVLPPRPIQPLFNYLIRPPQQRGRDREAEGFGGLEVDDQLELRGLLDGQIAGFGALEDLVNVDSGAPEEILRVRRIANKAAILRDMGVIRRQRWEPMLQGKVAGRFAVRVQECSSPYEYGGTRLS